MAGKFDRFMGLLREMHQTRTPLPVWAHMPYPREVDVIWPTMMVGKDLHLVGRAPAYMRSAAWRERRAVVLILARLRCSHCIRSMATQVHHNTYDHWGREPLADLEPVCRMCHCRIHGIRPHGAGLSDTLDRVLQDIERRRIKPIPRRA